MSSAGEQRMWLSGWGRYPVEPCYVARPTSTVRLAAAYCDTRGRTCIARGLGRSYGDAALNRDNTVLLTDHCAQLIEFDDERGVIYCEAGISLQKILAYSLPRGWFLPTTPGTKHVTLGGAIACDVHGKNHHVDGSFSRFVRSFELLTADGQVRLCSPERDEELFWATMGGMGLTGIILRARLQMIPVTSCYIHAVHRQTVDLDETLTCLNETGQQFRYSVAWLDALACGRALGRGVVMLGNHAEAHDLPAAYRSLALPSRSRPSRQLPVWLFSPLLQRHTARVLNRVYYWRHGTGLQLVDYESFFYPLDRLEQWNHIYGRRGFVQYQALLPHEHARAGMIELLEQVHRSRQSVYLAVLKTTGPASGGLLSYLFPGHTLALDFRNTGAPLRQLLGRLDEILLKHGGRVYLAKDAVASGETIAAMYPRLGELQRIKQSVDPQGRFSSSQARRLGLVRAA